ncbi:MAG: SUMF1/EgtB/PvdO family nonheme iron enzyme [Saprospiraceae bacterium]|jgi:sulfatase modifying factor 1|nr:SUMF1/EgtB/PvdO family nonheme iron enzyme [Saprospiraceae bacterium]
MKNLFRSFGILAVSAMALASCSNKGGEASSATGWKYNDAEWGGFEKKQYEGQIDGPNLVLVEGGTFTMGQTQEDIVWEYNYTPRRVTVSSFYMDETEVTNSNYREYLWWLKDKYYETYPEVYRKALPDTLVWRDELAFNEPYVETYFRHPAYDDYPVVGVSWLQASDFCKWRSNRVNEMILVDRGILNLTPDSKGSDVFDTKAYLSGQYQGSVKKNVPDIVTGGERPVMFDDGILLPDYRLPTEAEWEFAALALPGNQPSSNDEVYIESRFFPWNHNTARYKKRTANQGRILANFKRGEGDYMGVSGNLNDNASFPAPVRSYLPNDFGLYNMAGNVNEWVLDVYRATTSTTLNDAENQDLNPYRGNRFKTLVIDENGNPVEKDSLGSLKYRDVTDEESKLRENYIKGDVINHEDGNADYIKYLYGESTLISDKSRVFKGGSWSDRLYWLQPGTRRYKDEDKSDRNLGFRCAMVRVGGQAGNEDVGGNMFQEKGRNIKRRYK